MDNKIPPLTPLAQIHLCVGPLSHLQLAGGQVSVVVVGQQLLDLIFVVVRQVDAGIDEHLDKIR